MLQNIPPLLVSVDWLHSQLNNPEVVILYTRLANILTGEVEPSSGKYIPGAKLFDFESEFNDLSSDLPHTMPPAEVFVQQARQLGINSDAHIVVYDSHGLYAAPRVWWMFKSMGHDRISVLNGGLSAWQHAGLKTLDYPASTECSGSFTGDVQRAMWSNCNDVQQAMLLKNADIVDARSHERFTGQATEPRQGLRQGHIPGSINIPFTETQQQGVLLDNARLHERFSQAGLRSDRSIIFSCGSGVTACCLAFAATAVGFKRLSVYDGSWTEWGGRNDLPYETGSI